MISSGEVEIYLLPMDLEYSLEISGTGAGMVDLDVISPGGESSARVASFLSLPIGSGGKIAAEWDLAEISRG
jgi:hypothetical protein